MGAVPMPDPRTAFSRSRAAGRADSIRIQASTHDEAVRTLSGIAGGSMLGVGQSFRNDIEAIRAEYKLQIAALDAEMQARIARGVPDSEIRPWATAERTRIAGAMRLRQGRVATVLLNARDRMPPMPGPLKNLGGYGPDGRTTAGLERRALLSDKFRNSGLSLDRYLMRGAVSPNTGISDAAIRAGRYLKAGGKILVPLGVAASAYSVYKAPEGEKVKTAAVEGASWGGGYLASEGAVVVLLALAPETGGLTLLGVAAVVGVGALGGMASGWAAHKLLFTNHPHAASSIATTGTLPAHMVQTLMPPPPVPQRR